MPHANFVHLHVHTAYSLCEGAIKTDDLAKKAKALGMPAVAMTDEDSLGGAPTFTKDMTSQGVQPIVGLQAVLDHPEYAGEIVLLAQDEAGFKNLIKLTSNAYIRTTNGRNPRLTKEDLFAHNAGIILLTGGWRGPINKALLKGDDKAARYLLAELKVNFPGRTYVELVRHGLPQESAEPTLITLADELGLPLVATNDCFFLEQNGARAQDALICVKDGTYLAVEKRRRAIKEAWLKPEEAMRQLFADLPEACDNTVEIAKRCAVAFKKAKPMLPPFPGLDDQTEEEALRERAHAGLADRLRDQNLTDDARKSYIDRLNYELDVIANMGFPGYFLIVADFIGWSKDNGIPVGPGRGSGAGSIVAWAMRITDLDPLKFNLLFERFLNPERVSMPDFDIDFCQERREEVINYVKQRYGTDRAAQIGTIGKIKARSAVRDIGRVLQIPHGLVNRLCTMIPDAPTDKRTLKEIMVEEAPLSAYVENAEPQVKNMLGIAITVEGLNRNLSTHAAGVVIADRPLSDIVPLFRDKDGMLATQYDMKGVEDAGLVKFDFLGLKTLDVIQGTIDMVAEQGGKIDFAKIGLDDPRTFNMLALGESFGVFQLESVGMRKAIRQVKPTGIDDVIALNALYRPGPMENIPTYAAVKNGEKKASYLHPLMQASLEETFGVIIYQEQVMQLVQDLAGFTRGGADNVRRAMGKKIQSEMDAQRAIFIDGAKAGWVEIGCGDESPVRMHANAKLTTIDGDTITGKEALGRTLKDGRKVVSVTEMPGTKIEAELGEKIFELINAFANYGFNRSHAAAYGYIGYQTAYLKANYRHEFYASSMNLDLDKIEKLAEFAADMRRIKLKFRGPDVNQSQRRFSVEIDADGKKYVRWALCGIKGVGEDAMEHVIRERLQGGAFKSFHDFVARTAGKSMNKKAYEGLIRAGAMDCLHPNRAEMLMSLDQALAQGNSDAKARESGQISVFDFMAAPAENLQMKKCPDMPKTARLQGEFDVLGMYLTGHPVEEAEHKLANLSGRIKISDLQTPDFKPTAREVPIGVLLTDMFIRSTRKGEPMANLTLSDPTGTIVAPIFPQAFAQYRLTLKVGEAFVLRCGVEKEKDDKGEETGKYEIIVRKVEPLELPMRAAA